MTPDEHADLERRARLVRGGPAELPTDEEITDAGYIDAAEYLAHLKVDDEEAYVALLANRGAAWGDEPGEPTDPMARRVAHLISLIMTTLEENSSGTDDGQLTVEEVANWIKRHV